MRHLRLILAEGLILALLPSSFLQGQSVYGRIAGRLTNPAGTPVANATVTVTSEETGARSRTKTNSSGYYTLNNLEPSRYSVLVEGEGFERVQAHLLAVSADSTTTVSAVLQPGDSSTVRETHSSILKLDRTDVATSFDAEAIMGLPLLDRNVTQLGLLAPGASLARLLIPENQNPQHGIAVNINGQHFSGSAFQLDGTENRDPLEGIVVINPTLESVREMKVTTQGYNAEFGQATAGVVTVQTRTGSNAWHSSAFEYRRTGWGEAVDPFAPAGVPPTKRNIFGASLGGPIVRNRLFIFADFEGTRFIERKDRLVTVPSGQVRKTCLGSRATPQDPPCDLNQYEIISSEVYDDQKHLDANRHQKRFVNNQIPNPRVSDQAVALLKLLPAPNHVAPYPGCGDPDICDNYLASGAESFDADEFNVRADFHLQNNLRFFGRYSFGDFRDNGTPAFGRSGGGIGTNPSGFAGIAHSRNQGISSGFTYSLTPKLLTDFRFGYFRYRLRIDSQDFGTAPAAAAGILGVNDDLFSSGLPDMDIPEQNGLANIRFGYSNIANKCNCPLREREHQFQLVNNWTRNAGGHVFKWGGDLRWLQNFRLASDRRRAGHFIFSPDSTALQLGAGGGGLAMASFIIGDVGSFDRYYSNPANPNAFGAEEFQKRMAFYGQDSWSITRRFTVNYGLRWEIYFPQTVNGALRGGFLVPDFRTPDPAITYFRVPPLSSPNGNVENRFTNFGPRFGFAFLLKSDTVIRAGYGRGFDAGYGGATFGIAATQGPPLLSIQRVQTLFALNCPLTEAACQQPGALNTSPRPVEFPATLPFSLQDFAVLNVGVRNPAPLYDTPSSGATLYAVSGKVRIPTVDSWNFTIQHQLSPSAYFELGYVGDKGTHVFTDNRFGSWYNLNQETLNNYIIRVPFNQTIKDYEKFRCRNGVYSVDSSGNPLYCITTGQLRAFYLSPINAAAQRPFLFNTLLFPVRYFGNDASDNYHSLQAKIKKTFDHGSLMAHYTWSKGLDYDSDYFRVDPRVGYGPNNFDLSHRFVMTNIWLLPLGRGKALLGRIGPVADHILGGWMLSAITTWQSGMPFTPSYRNTNCTYDVGAGDQHPPCRPNRIGSVRNNGNRNQFYTTTNAQPLSAWCPDPAQNPDNQDICGFDPESGTPMNGASIGPWQRPGAGQIGSAGRNSLRQPAFFQSDMAVAKTFPLTERLQVRFRADIYNIFNKVNLGEPNGCVDCANGGQITSLADSALQRTWQFSLRVDY